MNNAAAYTPLESLLLFQSLLAYGTEPGAFTRISELLTNSELVKEDAAHDPARLNPDALRELYLHLLGEEVKAEDQAIGNDYETSPGGSKKRKLQSSPVPSVKEAGQHLDKLPSLVDRLYARYREYMVRSIREDEQNYEKVQREIREIESGLWDERIIAEDRAKQMNGHGHSKAEMKPVAAPPRASEARPLPDQAQAETKEQAKATPVSITVPPVLPKIEKRETPVAEVGSTPQRTASPAVVDVYKSQNGTPVLPAAQSRPTTDRPHVPSPALGQLKPATTPKPEGQWKWQEQYSQGPGTPNNQAKPHPPYPQPQPPPQGFPPHYYNQFPPRGYQPGQPYTPPPGHLPSTPHGVQPHPIVLPPNRPTGPSPRPDAPELVQYRPSQPSPHPHGVPPPHYRPPTVPSQLRPGETAAPSQGSPHWGPQHASPFPQNAGFPFTPQPAPRGFLHTRPDLQPQDTPRQYTSPYVATAARTQRPTVETVSSVSSTPQSGPSPVVSQPQTPLTRPLHYKTGRATRWTPTPSSNTPKAPRSPVRPMMEPLSPVLTKTPVLKLDGGVSLPPNGSSTKDRQRHRAARSQVVEPAASVASSQRSHSVTSQADEMSVDESTSHQKVKQESATPRMTDDSDDTADESTHKPSHNSPRPSRRPIKRKRHESPGRASGPPTHVLWVRNFPNVSSWTIQAIVSHRYGNTFAAPVKERDAPGYKSIILRPQDLKSIKSAVTAGHRAAATVAAGTDNDNGQATMMLPISEDLLPPKGIINATQLENEIVRMFANAIMYNADPNRGLGRLFQDNMEKEMISDNYEVDENGVVNEALAMFTDVEKILNDFRDTNRWGEDTGGEDNDDEDELGADNETHGGSIAKRRRRA